MSKVYKFKITLKFLENYIWREIEVTSVSSVAKLGYAVIAAFSGSACHLFSLHFGGNRYEIQLDDMGMDDEPVINPIKTKLEALKLTKGDKISMEYDFGAGWEFTLELQSISELKKGTGSHYPYVTDGMGRGIVEDSSPFDLVEMIEQTENTGKIPKVYDGMLEKEIEWDYRAFHLEFLNTLYKESIKQMQKSYEIFS